MRRSTTASPDSWRRSLGITRDFSALDRCLFALTAFVLPLLLLAVSLHATKVWPEERQEVTPQALPLQVAQDIGSQWEWAQAAQTLNRQTSASPRFVDTHRSTDAFWLRIDTRTLGEGVRLLLPSRHAQRVACWDESSARPWGESDRSQSLGSVRPHQAGFEVALAPSQRPVLLCRVHAEGPARLSAEAHDAQSWLAGTQRHERYAGFLEGGLLTLAGFLLLASLINRNITYLVFATWMVLNLRLAALSGGWDLQWLGHRVPPEWLTEQRQLTICAYYLTTYALFRRFFAQELTRIGQPHLLHLAAACTVAMAVLGLVLPFAQFLPAMWLLAPLGVVALLLLLARILWVTRSRVALWFAAALVVTLLASVHEVLAAALGLKALIAHFNHVTGALLASVLAAAAVAAQIKEERDLRRQAQAKLQQTYAAMPLGLFTLDMEGRLLASNPALRELLGERYATLQPQGWAALMGEASWQRLRHGALTQRVVEFEQDMHHGTSEVAPSRYLVRASLSERRIEGSLQDITERTRAVDHLKFLAENDPLTKVLNRRGIQQALQTELDGLRPGQHLCLAYLDLDRFKLINDLYGHPAGDEVLQQVCQRVQRLLSGEMRFGRVGGDEFLFVLPRLALPLASLLCRGITSAIGNGAYTVGDRAFQVRGSLGLVEISAGTRAKDAIAAADRACREAKRQAADGVVIYEHDAGAFVEQSAEMALVNQLSHQQDIRGLFVEMQPIMSLSRPQGSLNFEVLLRMNDEQGQRVPTFRLIHAAEHAGRMSHVDRWVLQHVLGWLRAHRAELTRTQFVCMNLSGTSLNDERFLDDAFELLNEYLDVAPLLCLEVTESIALHDLDNTRRFIHQVRQTGAKVALDDFGAGYTSFSYLAELPSDLLKIDGSFVRDMNRKPANIAIVEAIVSLAHNLGMKTIAEWAEDAATVETLAEIGVDYVQGFAVAKPQAPEVLLTHRACGDFLQGEAMQALGQRLERLGNTPELVVGTPVLPVRGSALPH